MNTTFILLLTIGLFIGCKKDDAPVVAPDPDFTVGLIGEYPMTYYRERIFLLDLSNSTVSGKFTISKMDFTHIKAILTMTIGGKTQNYQYAELELQRDNANPNLYSLRAPGRSAGTITANDILYTGTFGSADALEIKGKR